MAKIGFHCRSRPSTGEQDSAVIASAPGQVSLFTVHMFIIEGLMMIVVVGATRTRKRLVPRLVQLGGEE